MSVLTTADTPGDLALLRQFEPIICYTRGESFFPMPVEAYVSAASLWVERPNQFPIQLYKTGDTTLNTLAEAQNFPFGSVLYLKFIDPVRATEMAAMRIRGTLPSRDPKDRFVTGRSRLARVGYTSRLVDALFTLSLLARGRVPGDTAVAAIKAYNDLQPEGQRTHTYYGRVVRKNGWVALQYWFFYAFNNWRSGFNGANDHEADWEQIFIYLYPDGNGRLRPEWVAYASHDFSGDDLRRRWDDPELRKEGDHPVVYAGAGSHASYYTPGEYLTEIQLPFWDPARRGLDRLQEMRYALLPSAEAAAARRWSDVGIFRVPFVDYARGDGRSIGPGTGRPWTEPRLIDPPPPWVAAFRGLWGLHARDPFSGENAPAGPKYNRDGSTRDSWYDPLGWAGLDKVTPPQLRSVEVEARRRDLAEDRHLLEVQIEEREYEMGRLVLELEAMTGRAHMKALSAEHQTRLAALTGEVQALKAQLSKQEAIYESLSDYADDVAAGVRGSPRSHIRRAHHPAVDPGVRYGRFAEAWAAVSIGLLMLGVVALALFASQYLVLGVLAMLTFIVFIEAGIRGQFVRLLSSISIALAVVGGLLIVYQFFWQIVILLLLLAGTYIMWDNLRELRH